jgi:transposase-like protein
MGAYDMPLNVIQDNGIFERDKIPLGKKVLGYLLYLSGLSYRAMTLQTGIIHACYSSVHYWIQKLRGITSKVKKRYRRIVAIDKTKLKVSNMQLFVWSIIDPDTRELLAVHSSYQR